MKVISVIVRTTIACTCLFLPYTTLADSAAAWKAYQEGRDPFVEVGLIFVGVVVFFIALGLLNSFLEKRKRKRIYRSSGKQK